MVSDFSAVRMAVSGWVALRRAAIGAGLALAACAVIQLFGRPIGAFLPVTVVTWSAIALYNGLDRRCRIAGVTAAAGVAAVWFGAEPLAHAGVPGNVARAALCVLAGSQIYAAVTRLGHDRQAGPTPPSTASSDRWAGSARPAPVPATTGARDLGGGQRR